METSEPLEPNSNPSTSLQAAIPASHSAKLESAAAPTIRGIFGPSSRESFAYFDHDTCSWKTSQATFLWDSGMFSETWPDSGTMRNGSVCGLRISERPTCESGSSSWPTARGEDGESCGNHPGATDSLTGATRNWSTASAHDGRRPGSDATSTQGANLKRDVETWKTPHGMSNRDSAGKVGGCGGGEFGKQANNWATPQEHYRHQGSEKNANRPKDKGGQRNLTDDVMLWQTPAMDSFRSRGGDRKDEMGLDQQARFFPTPASRDYRTPNKKALSDRGGGSKGEQLQNFVEHSHQVPVIQDGPQSSESGQTSRRRLNPQFVEWLMGFPIGWSLPCETERNG